MDIGTEPEGKQNSTAPLQTSNSEGKGCENIANGKINQQKNAEYKPSDRGVLTEDGKED